MKALIHRMASFFADDGGATATEYAVMLAMIIIVCIGAISALGTKVSSTFVDIETGLP
jgi:pilus assembly protein Flp/PilA